MFHIRMPLVGMSWIDEMYMYVCMYTIYSGLIEIQTWKFLHLLRQAIKVPLLCLMRSTLSQMLPLNCRVRVDNHANLFAAVHAKLGRNCRRRHRCEYLAPVWGAFIQCWHKSNTGTFTFITVFYFVEGFWPPNNWGLSRPGQFSAEYRRNCLLHLQRMPQSLWNHTTTDQKKENNWKTEEA